MKRAATDTYTPICLALPRLCPRLVPSPLWGLSLARLSRTDPQTLCSLLHTNPEEQRKCMEALQELHHWWLQLPRTRCTACGANASDIDEEWLYLDEEPAAVLEAIRPLCRKCHLAKHLGYALVTGKLREAITHLAHVNMVDEDTARQLAAKAFKTHEELSKKKHWRIKIKPQPGLREETRETLEQLLNRMHDERYSIDRQWITYTADEKQLERIEEEALKETKETLEEALGVKHLDEALEKIRQDSQAAEKLIETLRRHLETRGVRLLWRETLHALNLIAQQNPLEAIDALRGKWIVFVKPELRGPAMRKITRRLRANNLDYAAKTPAHPQHGEKPVIIQTPSLLAPKQLAATAQAMQEALAELGVEKPLIYKPDIYTAKGIYRGNKHGLKPYTYITLP
ncbi:MAG: hypothetical protein GXO09_05905 [Crenarchaeota archaeon]|nr:hypothetical protein [Thermoproteota archaeon]